MTKSITYCGLKNALVNDVITTPFHSGTVYRLILSEVASARRYLKKEQQRVAVGLGNEQFSSIHRRRCHATALHVRPAAAAAAAAVRQFID